MVAPSNGIAAARDVFNDVLDGGGGLVACQKCTLQNDRKLKVGFVLGILMGTTLSIFYKRHREILTSVS